MPHHIHHHHEQHARAAEPDVATVESVVYVTASPTFEGPVVGYTTPGSEPATQAGAQQAQQAAGGAPQFFNAGASSASVAPAPAAAATSQQAQNALPAAASNQPSAAGAAVSSQQTQVASGAAATTLVSSAASSQNQPNPTMPSSTQLNIVKGNSLSTSVPGGQNAGTTAAPTAAPEDSSHHGMSSGAQAGLAIGILALVGILVGVAYIFYRRRATSQAEKHKKLDDEKNGFNEKTGFDQMQPGLVPRVSIRKHGGEAPRLSMRPTTEMFDNGAAMSERKGAANGGFATAAVAGARGNSQEERKSEEPVNPFGDHATTAPVEAPKPLNISRPSTPNGQAPQSPSTSPGVAAGSAPPGGPGPMNVHRVQLDFAPSMEDELELRAGQLVRMLHEYDDGWVSVFITIFVPRFQAYLTHGIRPSASASIARSKALSLVAASPSSQ